MPETAADAIDSVLPQTQCTQCGYAGCRPYAEAIAAGEADINQCPPGGDTGIRALAAMTGRPPRPLDTGRGAHKPRFLAVIDELRCIGCTICIQKCPVDAIVGAAKVMHTVIGAECTGCELCVAPCPVDCIALLPVPASHPALVEPRAAADIARARHRDRLERLRRMAAQRVRSRAPNPAPPAAAMPAVQPPPFGSPEHREAAIAAAQERARARRARAESA